MRRPFAYRVIGTLVLVLLVGSSAFGQYFVQPVRVQLSLQPGRRFQTEVKIENLGATAVEEVGLRILDVTQDVNGVWLEIERDAVGIDRSNLRSCAEWLSIEQDSVQVNPGGIVPVRLTIEVPPGMRGYYFAALMARSAPRPAQVEGITSLMILEHLVPVILEVQGRTMRHEIELADVGLEFRSQTPTKAASTLVTMDVHNAGGTYSRLQGLTRIWNLWGGHWRKVTETKFTDQGIIPGAKLHLRQDVGRPLASGKYKVEGFLYVDGQRNSGFQREFEFAGDPRVTVEGPGVDALDLETKDLVVETVPGAVRAVSLPIANASEEAVTVAVDLVLPDHMRDVVSARGVPGEAFGCAEWVTVDPPQFTLQGYSRLNLRIAARMPNTLTTPLANYYGLIRLHATHADGKPGGVTTARLCVRHRGVPPTVQVDNLTFTVAQSGPSRYLAVARFINNGDAHVIPTCRAALTSPGDNNIWTRLILSSEAYDQTGMLFPLDTRNFSGVLDVSRVPPGLYRLTTILEYPGGSALPKQIAVEVVEEGGGKAVNLVGLDKVGGTVPIKF